MKRIFPEGLGDGAEPIRSTPHGLRNFIFLGSVSVVSVLGLIDLNDGTTNDIFPRSVGNAIDEGTNWIIDSGEPQYKDPANQPVPTGEPSQAQTIVPGNSSNTPEGLVVLKATP